MRAVAGRKFSPSAYNNRTTRVNYSSSDGSVDSTTSNVALITSLRYLKETASSNHRRYRLHIYYGFKFCSECDSNLNSSGIQSLLKLNPSDICGNCLTVSQAQYAHMISFCLWDWVVFGIYVDECGSQQPVPTRKPHSRSHRSKNSAATTTDSTRRCYLLTAANSGLLSGLHA